jgi:hypothetical protein
MTGGVPVRGVYRVSLVGSAAMAVSAFLPWLRVGDVSLAGIPDPAGFFVVAVGVLGVVLSAAGLLSRRDPRYLLVLAGLAGVTTLGVVWRSGPATVAERAQARAEAISIVDNVPLQQVPPVRTGTGLFVGLAGAIAVTGVGLTGLRESESSSLTGTP